jgi:hypothetical protein
MLKHATKPSPNCPPPIVSGKPYLLTRRELLGAAVAMLLASPAILFILGALFFPTYGVPISEFRRQHHAINIGDTRAVARAKVPRFDSMMLSPQGDSFATESRFLGVRTFLLDQFLSVYYDSSGRVAKTEIHD